MPWTTPGLEDVRKQTRDFVTGKLRSPLIPNSVARVIADAMAGLAYLVLLYIDWLARQFLPDTAETEWLDRHGDIWVGGREAATYAYGSATFTGINGTVVPAGAKLVGPTGAQYQVAEQISVGIGATPAAVAALTPGTAGNAETGAALTLVSAIAGIDAQAIVVAMTGGVDVESDDSLRERVLFRIQKPPMGGDADDYVRWAREVPGCTRAWSSPLEQGIGTVTIRVMFDELRAAQGGLPTQDDLDAVRAHMDEKRPVAVKDFFVEAPVFEPIDFTISALDSDDAATRAAIEVSVKAMLADKAAPAHAINGVAQDAQTIYAAWVSDAILSAAGVKHFDLTMADHPMPYPGNMAVLGTITYE